MECPVAVVFYLGAFYFFYFAIIGVYVIFMPQVSKMVGYSPFEVGVLFASAPLMRFLVPFFFRRWFELTPTIFNLSLLTAFLSTLSFFITIDNFYLFLISHLLFGITLSISLPYVETVALEVVSKERYGKVRLYGSIGFMLIALFLGSYLQSAPQAIAYISAMAFFTMVFGMLIINTQSVEQKTPKAQSGEFSLLTYWPFWVSAFLMQMSFGGFYQFFTIYELDMGLSMQIISFMWAFGVLCEIAMLYFQGPLLQKNLLMLLKITVGLTSLRWFLLYLYPDSTSVVFATQAIHAFSFALYHTAAISYVYILYKDKKLAQQFFLGIAFGLGAFVGSIAAGIVYGPYLFLFEAGVAFLAFGVLFLQHRYVVRAKTA
ncbi:MAG: MFS transporter [Campylobacterota bacterium]